MNIIELQNVSKTYNKGEAEIKALASVDIKIAREEFVAIMGASGSGKTMMAQAIANELGALFINLSAEKVRGKFMGKIPGLKLIHSVNSCLKLISLSITST